MIKTLRIASIIVAVLTVVFLVLPAFIGVRSDEQVDKFLNSPDAIENFKIQKGKKDTKSSKEASPLVKEATAFGLYLNPPPKPERSRQAASKTKKAETSIIPGPKKEVSAKFDLIGTVYYSLVPQSSLALIDEPGKGLGWVRQGDEVNHLIFKQIKDGIVVVKDGNHTREIKVPPRDEKQRFLKFLQPGKTASGPVPTTVVKSRTKPLESVLMSSREQSAIGALFDKIASEMRRSESEDKKITTKQIDELFSSLAPSRVNDTEANRLRDLGKIMEKNRDTSVRDSNSTKIRDSNSTQR